MKTRNILTGILAGTAAVSVLTIIYLAGKDTPTGRRIMSAEKKYGKRLMARVDDFMEFMNDKFDSAKKETEDIIETRKSKHNGTMKDLKEALS